MEVVFKKSIDSILEDYTLFIDHIEGNYVTINLYNNTDKIVNIKIKDAYYITKHKEQLRLYPPHQYLVIDGLIIYPGLFQRIIFQLIRESVLTNRTKGELIIVETEINNQNKILACYIEK